jgi:hypothetical protein
MTLEMEAGAWQGQASLGKDMETISQKQKGCGHG